MGARTTRALERLEAHRDFERRLGCPERYLAGATGDEPLPPCERNDLTGAALMATRAELEDVRDRLARAAADRQTVWDCVTVIPGAE